MGESTQLPYCDFEPTLEGLDRSGSPHMSQLETEILAKMGCLPPQGDAVRIAELYYKNASFMQAPSLLPFFVPSQWVIGMR